MTPADYCRAAAAPEGSNLYYALLFHGPAQRRAIAGCFAFLAELHRESQHLEDPTPVVRRLQWWLEQLEPASLAAATHPVMAELRQLEPDAGLLRAALAPCVVAALQDMTAEPSATWAEWHSRCRTTTAGAWQLAARYAGADPGNARVSLLAILCTQLDQLLDIAPRTAQGRCPLPRATLQHHGIDPALKRLAPKDAGLDAALRSTAADLRQGIQDCLSADPDAGRLPLFCRVLARMHVALCDGMLRNPGRVCVQRPVLLPLHKLWIAWRAQA